MTPRSPTSSRDVPARPRAVVRWLGVVAHLRSADSGAIGQLVRYGVAGGLVTLVYITVTTVLAQVLGMAFEIALVIGFVTAVLLHFTLQRRFVWSSHTGFELPVQHQVIRYLVMMGTQYGFTAASTAVLPGVIGLSTEVVYIATVAVVAAAGFLTMRFVIFHGKSPTAASTLRLG